MRIASITWNGNSDITKFVFSDVFISSDRIVHLDVLLDMLAVIEELYDKKLESEQTIIPKSIKL